MSLGEGVFGRIREFILRPLEDLESSVEAIMESVVEPVGVERPRLLVTLNDVDECSPGDSSNQCSTVTGRYRVEDSLIVMNYRSSLGTLIHLLIHHLQSIEEGRAKYLRIRQLEELKLPWELRFTEINAMSRLPTVMGKLDPRARRIWNEEVKSKIREIEENLPRIRTLVAHIMRYEEQAIEGRNQRKGGL
jgi:hypothetical protein